MKYNTTAARLIEDVIRRIATRPQAHCNHYLSLLSAKWIDPLMDSAAKVSIDEKSQSSSSQPFVCGLCNELMKEPLRTQCCQGSICTPCLYDWQQVELTADEFCESFTCPLCRASYFKFVEDEGLQHKMEDTVIPCKNSSLGCPWSGEVVQLSDHLEDCSYASQPCPHNCGKLVRRNLLTEHLLSNKCVLEWTKCERCSNAVSSVDSHTDATCPSYLLLCPNQCGVTVKRSQLPQHEKECPLSFVDCPFKEAGCSATKMQRKENTHHLNQEHVQHLQSAFQYLQTELSSLKSQLQSTQDDQRAMTKELQKARKEFATVKFEVEKQKIATEVLATTFRTELGYFHPSCSCEAFALECANTRLAMLTNRSTAFIRPNSPALTFRLTNYSTLKKNKQPWYSPPFYIREGYKMCIAVHLNGDQEGQGTHMSVHIHLMAGEYDAKLKWPLAYSEELAISLMKQQCGDKEKQKNRRASQTATRRKQMASRTPSHDSVQWTWDGMQSLRCRSQTSSRE